MPKIYLSPAYHYNNTCSIAGCDETTHNNLYLDELEPFLKACGIDYKRGPRRTPRSNEDANAYMRQAVRESNEFKADIHYVSHTNASGNTVGQGKARGYRPLIYPGSVNGKKIAQCIIAERKKIYNQPIKLNETRSNLYELRVPHAPSYYEEHVFHDNLEDAKWFHANLRNIARATAKGFCEYFALRYRETKDKKYLCKFVDPYAGQTVVQKEEKPVVTKDEYTLKEFIKDVQKACGAKVDGIAGPETLAKTVTLSAKKNSRHPAVKAVQKRLYELGYIEVGTADGDAGPKFTSAVAHFQRDNNCAVDGEITAQNKTWKKLLGMA